MRSAASRMELIHGTYFPGDKVRIKRILHRNYIFLKRNIPRSINVAENCINDFFFFLPEE